jgi:hypothetical protein
VPFRVVVELLVSVVNAPVLGTVPPTAGGEAKYALKPVPETVPEAAKLVVDTDVSPERLEAVSPSLIVVEPKTIGVLKFVSRLASGMLPVTF